STRGVVQPLGGQMNLEARGELAVFMAHEQLLSGRNQRRTTVGTEPRPRPARTLAVVTVPTCTPGGSTARRHREAASIPFYPTMPEGGGIFGRGCHSRGEICGVYRF